MSDATLADVVTGLVKERLRRDECVSFTIVSASMLPWLPVGSKVIVQSVEAGALRIGDVVIARLPDGRLNTHRLIRKFRRDGHWHWVTKGDHNPHADAACADTKYEIVGVVKEWRRPFAGERTTFRVNMSEHPVRLLSVIAAMVSRAEAVLADSRSLLMRRLACSGARRVQRLLNRVACQSGLRDGRDTISKPKLV